MTKTIKNLTETDKLMPTVFRVLCGASLCVAVLYVVFFYNVVSGAVDIKQSSSLVADYGSEIQRMETEFFALSSEINLERARGLGFSEASEIAYASRQSLFAVSMNGAALAKK